MLKVGKIKSSSPGRCAAWVASFGNPTTATIEPRRQCHSKLNQNVSCWVHSIMNGYDPQNFDIQ
ncbi:hypothetical protein, partial [Chromatium okenii]|uniref:hypothetical protein n=1 Tax=Chromatium okenii TaxID=61644 RepID=UPI0026F30898